MFDTIRKILGKVIGFIIKLINGAIHLREETFCSSCGHWFDKRDYAKRTSSVTGKNICLMCYEEEQEELAREAEERKIADEVAKGLRCAECKKLFSFDTPLGMGVMHPKTKTKLCFNCFENVSDRIRTKNEIILGVRCPNCQELYTQNNPKTQGLNGEIFCYNCYAEQVRKEQARQEQERQEELDRIRRAEQRAAAEASRPSLRESFMSGYNSVDKTGSDKIGKAISFFQKNVMLEWTCSYCGNHPSVTPPNRICPICGQYT